MRYRIVKLDGRHSWSKIYSFCLEFSRDGVHTGVLDFDRARKWMNATWGWSQDVETQSAMINALVRSKGDLESEINHYWAYSIAYRDYRIYLAGEAELNWFVLANPCNVQK